MKFINTIPDFPDAMLRRMVAWCCKELELPCRYVKEIAFRKSSRAYGGLARRRGTVIGVRVGDASKFPTPTFKHRWGLQETIADRIEALVAITAHELAHAEAYYRQSKTRKGGAGGGSERATDVAAFRVLRTFRENRAALLAAWNPAPAVVEPPAADEAADIARAKELLAAAKAAHLRTLLAKWEAKKKRAETAIRKYRAKIRYQEKRAALLQSAAVKSPPK